MDYFSYKIELILILKSPLAILRERVFLFCFLLGSERFYLRLTVVSKTFLFFLITRQAYMVHAFNLAWIPSRVDGTTSTTQRFTGGGVGWVA